MASVLERLAALEETVEQHGYGLDGLAERIDALQSETGRRAADEIAELERRIVLLELANKGLVSLIEHEAAEINTRITTVHAHALRELTRRIERSQPS